MGRALHSGVKAIFFKMRVFLGCGCPKVGKRQWAWGLHHPGGWKSQPLFGWWPKNGAAEVQAWGI